MSSYIDFLLTRFQENQTKEAIIWKDKIFKYQYIVEKFAFWRDILDENEVPEGSVVSIEADFSPNSITLFLALSPKFKSLTISLGKLYSIFD